MNVEKRGNIEVRLDEAGDLDEVVTHGPTRFHLERMNDSAFWLRWDQDGADSLVVFMSARGEALEARHHWDLP